MADDTSAAPACNTRVISSSGGGNSCWDHFTMGFGVGCIERVLKAPIEAVKYRMTVDRGQTGPDGRVINDTSATACARRLLRSDGIGGFLNSGLLSTCAHRAPQTAILLATNHAVLAWAPSVDTAGEPQPGVNGVLTRGVAGAAAGVTSSLWNIAFGKLRTVHTRYMNKGAAVPPLAETIAEIGGFKAIFRGSAGHILHGSVHTSLLLTAFYGLQQVHVAVDENTGAVVDSPTSLNPYAHEMGVRGWASTVCAAYVARVAAEYISFPLTTLARYFDFQVNNKAPETTFRRCASEFVRSGDFLRQYKPFRGNVRPGIAFAVTFAMYDRGMLGLRQARDANELASRQIAAARKV